jgi:hypothetical protein
MHHRQARGQVRKFEFGTSSFGMKLGRKISQQAPETNDSRTDLRIDPPEVGQGFFERCLHLLALSSLTVAQPMLDLLSRHHEFFVIRRFDRIEIVGLAVTLLFVIPAPFVAIEALLLRAPRLVQKSVHLIFVWFFGVAFALLVLKRAAALPAAAVIGVAILLAAAGTLVYGRIRAARSFIGLLAIALVAVPAVFFLNPQVSKLLARRQSIDLDLPSVRTEAPIVFVLFDEFSLPVLLDAKMQINRNRYPNFAALADRSTWYRGAVAAAEYTGAAVPAILTAVEPEVDQVPSLADHPNNLFTLFGGNYRLWVDEPMTQLCPPELNRKGTVRESRWERIGDLASDFGVVYLHLILPQAWGERLPTISSGWSDFGGGVAPAPPADGAKSLKSPKSFFKQALHSVRQDRRPGVDLFVRMASDPGRSELFFIHLMLPHRPWDLLPDGSLYTTDGRPPPCLARDGWCSDPRLVAQGLQRYILHTMYVDTVIGRLMSGLEAAGRFDETLIVLVADHGMGFTPGEHQRVVTDSNAHDVLPVPLLIKAPRQTEGEVIDRRVSTLDVLPTILEILGEKKPWPMDGVSLVNIRGPNRSPLRVLSKRRGIVEVDPSALKAKRRFVNNKLRLFGDGSDPESIFCYGRHVELCGRPTRDLEIVDELRWGLEITNADALQNVDLDGLALPALLSGTARPPRRTRSAQNLAVALNGVIVANTVTKQSGKRRHVFSALLPPTAFRQGENTVELFKVTGQRGDLTLRAVPLD